MSTPVNSTTPFTRPNVFDDPTPFNRVRVAGILISSLVTAFNGLKIEDAWKKQKSKNASGAIFAFNGTDPVGGEGGFSITFRATARDDFDQLYDLYDALKPAPVLGGGASGTATSTTKVSYSNPGSPPKPDDATAEQQLASAQAALAALDKPTPAASSVDAAASQQAASSPQPSPGPRPPTVPIECGWLAFLGVFAVARKSFEFSTIEPDKYEITIGFVVDKPPTPAGAGAMAAPKAATTAAATTTTVGAGYKGAVGT